MKENKKTILALTGIVIAIVIFFLTSTGESDFSDGGKPYWCNSCNKVNFVEVGYSIDYYAKYPERVGQPLLCPVCRKSSLVPGAVCPAKGCFYTSPSSKNDGTAICPKCKADLYQG